MRAAAFETVLPGGPITCLPLTMVQTASRASPLLMLVLALPAVSAVVTPFWLIAAHTANDQSLVLERPETAVLLAVTFVAWSLLFGWPLGQRALRFGNRRRIELDARHVHVTERAGFWRTSWTEPVASYDGLTHRVRASLSGIRHELILIHPDPRRSLLLRVADRITQSETDQLANLLGCREIAPQPFYRRRVPARAVTVQLSPSLVASAAH